MLVCVFVCVCVCVCVFLDQLKDSSNTGHGACVIVLLEL
jgi:hypothetical protein